MNIVFNESYYNRIIIEHGYKAINFSPINFSINSLSIDLLKYKWLCHIDGDLFSESLSKQKKCIVTTGFGLSGIPHVGTISQMLGAILLQKAGLKVQIVLGDLDSYNSRNQPLEIVKERANQYYNFIIALGFDVKSGIIRNQIDHLDVLLTSYLNANVLRDADFLETEEDISFLYKKNGIYQGIEFPVKQAILLMASDFIALGKNYDNILVTLGIDEHKYVQLARKIILKKGFNFSIAGMYSRVTKGFNGYPKMSKSFPKSSISVDMEPSAIFNAITKYESESDDPLESTVFQMMCQMSTYSVSQLNELYFSCMNNDAQWGKNKKEYVDFIIELFRKWRL